MTKKRRTKLDKIRERNAQNLIGRKEPIRIFKQHLDCGDPDDDDFIDILNIYGQGGVGKTFLCNKLIEMAKAKGAVVGYTDEAVTEPLGFMESIAKQFDAIKEPLKSFSARLKVYKKEKKELESDPEAPSGWLPFITKAIVKTGLNYADTAAGGMIGEVVDKEGVGKHVSELASYLQKKKKNKVDEIELVLNPIEVLSPLFIEDLSGIAEKRHVCLIADNYETVSQGLDKWLLEVYNGKYGDPPLDLTLIVSGRDQLDSNEWTGLTDFIRSICLEPFTEDEAKEYLSSVKITDESTINTIIELSFNLPLLVSMLAKEAPSSSEDVKDFSSNAVERFIKWIKDPIKRDLVLHTALTRFFDQDIIKVLLPNKEDAQVYFDWLCNRPFVQKRGGKWAYHPVVRELMLRNLQQRSFELWEQINLKKLASFYQKKMDSLEFDISKDEICKEQWLVYTNEYYYHQMLVTPEKSFIKLMQIISMVFRVIDGRATIPLINTIREVESFKQINLIGDTLQKAMMSSSRDNKTDVLKAFQIINSKQIIVNQEDSAFFYLNEGALLHDLGEIDLAIEKYKQVIELTPNNLIAICFLGEAYRAKQKLDKAIEQFKIATNLKNDDAELYYHLADSLFDIGELDEAINSYNQSILLNDTNPDILNDLGYALSLKGDFDLAIQRYEQAIKLESDHVYALNNLGNALKEKGELDKAIKVYEDIIKLHPNHVFAYNNLGIVLKENGELDEAIKMYKQAISLKEDHFSALYNLGNVLVSKGELDSAISMYQKAIDVKPEDIPSYYCLGQLYLDKEEFDLAIEIYEKLLRLKYDDVFAFRKLGSILFKKGELDLAIESLVKASDLEPKNLSIIYSLGCVFKQKREIAFAIEHLGESIERDPDSEDDYVVKGIFHIIQHQFELAIFNLELSLRFSADNLLNIGRWIGHCFLCTGENIKALEWYQKSLNLLSNKNNKSSSFLEEMKDEYQIIKMSELGISESEYQEILDQLKL